MIPYSYIKPKSLLNQQPFKGLAQDCVLKMLSHADLEAPTLEVAC